MGDWSDFRLFIRAIRSETDSHGGGESCAGFEWVSCEPRIYSVVNNLGSLVVRFLFQPVEEVLYSTFLETWELERRGLCGGIEESVGDCSAPDGHDWTCFWVFWASVLVDCYSHCLHLEIQQHSSTDSDGVVLFLHSPPGSKWYVSFFSPLPPFDQVFNLMNNNNNNNNNTHKRDHRSFHAQCWIRVNMRRLNLVLIGFSVLFVSSATLLLRIPGLSTVGLVIANIMSILLQNTLSFIFEWIGEPFFLISNSKLRHGTSDWIQFMVYQEPLQRTWLISEFFENSTISTRFNHTCCIVRNHSLNQGRFGTSLTCVSWNSLFWSIHCFNVWNQAFLFKANG